MSFRIDTSQIQDPAVRQALDLLSAMLPWFGGKQYEVRIGTGTWTFPGGQTASNATTVTHGLGRAPVIAYVQNNQNQGANEVCSGETFNYTSTGFDSKGVFKALTPAAAATSTFVWFAIG